MAGGEGVGWRAACCRGSAICRGMPPTSMPEVEWGFGPIECITSGVCCGTAGRIADPLAAAAPAMLGARG